MNSNAATAVPVPPAIVAKAESGSLLAAAVEALTSEALALYHRGAETDLAHVEFARKVCALAADPARRKEVEQINARRRADPAYVGGRPSTVHALAFARLTKRTGLPERTFLRWLKNWNLVAEALGIEKDAEEQAYVSEKTVKEGYSPRGGKPLTTWLDSVLHPPKADPADADQAIFDPRRLADRVGARIQRFLFDKGGNPILRTKQQKMAFAKRLNELLHAANVGWELLPHERS